MSAKWTLAVLTCVLFQGECSTYLSARAISGSAEGVYRMTLLPLGDSIDHDQPTTPQHGHGAMLYAHSGTGVGASDRLIAYTN